MQVKFDVKPEDYARLFGTAAGSGYANYWCERMTGYRLTRGGNWRRSALHDPHTYAGVWRVAVLPKKFCVGDKCFDGHQWGWAEGVTVASKHIVNTEMLELAFPRSPGFFAAWLEDDRFDGPCAEQIVQVACFGIGVYV